MTSIPSSPDKSDLPAVWHPCGDTALLLDLNGYAPSWTDSLSPFEDKTQLITTARHLSALIRARQETGQLTGIIDVVPGLGSVLIHYDPCQTSAAYLKQSLTPVIHHSQSAEQTSQRRLSLPVCYDEEFSPDLEDISSQCGLSAEEAIQLHLNAVFEVAIMGFLPGLGYMTGLPEVLRMPRRSNPRTHVDKGAVGIAMDQCVIYPLDSPGGWNLIGRMPVPLCDIKRTQPLLLQPGDRVEFYQISRQEYDHIDAECQTSGYSLSAYLIEPETPETGRGG